VRRGTLRAARAEVPARNSKPLRGTTHWECLAAPGLPIERRPIASASYHWRSPTRRPQAARAAHTEQLEEQPKMRIARVALWLAAALFCGVAMGQQWPNKPARILVPFAAGGNTDSLARISADWLARAFNQQFVVENRPGAFGSIAADALAKSPPDGYTLLMAAHAQAVTVPLMLTKKSYDPEKDFAPVSIVGSNAFVLGVHASVPVNNVREFIEYAKSRPGQVNYASGGSGSMSHLSAALLAHRAGVSMNHVPYKGGAPAVKDLLGGQVQMYFGNFSDFVGHAESGRVKVLAVSSDKRAQQRPDVPTIAESGYPGFRTVTWNGLVAPAGTPRDIVQRISQEVQKMVRDTATAQRLLAMGVDPWGSTPEEFTEAIKNESALWAEPIRATNIKLD
jgi:tripartite-type tricarboxylate transporter receptor subunit TctC